MTGRILQFGPFPLGILILSMSAATAQNIDIAASESFVLQCPAYARECPESDQSRKTGEDLLVEMERIRIWFDEIGFPTNERMPRDGDREVILTGRTVADVCTADAVACHRVDMLSGSSHIWLPVDQLERIGAKTGTLAHEYLHARQPDRDAGSAIWLREAVATAVGEAWDIRNGWGFGDYPPIYRLSLDLPFHYGDMNDAEEYAGYRNWLYLLFLGEKMASKDRVGYLARDAFMMDTRYDDGQSATAMTPLYDASATGGHVFADAFAEYVAILNNLDREEAPNNERFLYFKSVEEVTVHAPDSQQVTTLTHEGKANAYAAVPLYLKLDMGSDPAAASLPAAEQLMQAEVEIIKGDFLPDLSLVVEHRLAESRHRTAWLLDGSDPPDELGFHRVVHAPRELAPDRGPSGFTLQVRLLPVEVMIPPCIQQGAVAAIDMAGMDPEGLRNWRLTTDNGQVSGLEFTPAAAGEITLGLEIDGPVTRQVGTLDPGKPRTTQIPLGTFPVAADACMIRMTVVADGGGPEAVHIFSYDGEYSEIQADAGTAIYLSADDIALYRSGWVDLPPQAKTMILPSFMGGTGIPAALAPGEDEVETGGPFMGRMPHAFSKRFSWASLRGAPGVGGAPVRRSQTDCPKEGSGCSAITFAMDGIAVPVIFDSLGRPVRVTFEENGARGHMQFEYGSWVIRRPPGW